MVLGVSVHGNTVTDVEVTPDKSWWSVPIPARLGMPLVYKRMSGTGGDDSHIRSNIIVRFMGDPEEGMAPLEWQYGGQKGPAPPVALARRDKVPFSQQDWHTVDDYIRDWLDELADGEDEGAHVVSKRVLTPEKFQQFVRDRSESHPTACLSYRFPVGSIVVAEGLSVEELNGKEGEVLQFGRDRVGVKFPDRAVTALKPERLKLVREAPVVEEPAAKRQDSGETKEARKEHLAREDAKKIAERFCECMGQDTFPEMDDLHLFGLGTTYKARAQEVLAVWQGCVKRELCTEEMITDALMKGRTKDLFMQLCFELSITRAPNSPYAKNLISANFAALEWDTL